MQIWHGITQKRSLQSKNQTIEYYSCVFEFWTSAVQKCLFQVDSALQGGITCGAIDEPRKSLKAIDERVIINFRDKNVVIARFRDKNVYR